MSLSLETPTKLSSHLRGGSVGAAKRSCTIQRYNRNRYDTRFGNVEAVFLTKRQASDMPLTLVDEKVIESNLLGP